MGKSLGGAPRHLRVLHGTTPRAGGHRCGKRTTLLLLSSISLAGAKLGEQWSPSEDKADTKGRQEGHLDSLLNSYRYLVEVAEKTGLMPPHQEKQTEEEKVGHAEQLGGKLPEKLPETHTAEFTEKLGERRTERKEEEEESGVRWPIGKKKKSGEQSVYKNTKTSTTTKKKSKNEEKKTLKASETDQIRDEVKKLLKLESAPIVETDMNGKHKVMEVRKVFNEPSFQQCLQEERKQRQFTSWVAKLKVPVVSASAVQHLAKDIEKCMAT